MLKEITKKNKYFLKVHKQKLDENNIVFNFARTEERVKRILSKMGFEKFEATWNQSYNLDLGGMPNDTENYLQSLDYDMLVELFYSWTMHEMQKRLTNLCMRRRLQTRRINGSILIERLPQDDLFDTLLRIDAGLEAPLEAPSFFDVDLRRNTHPLGVELPMSDPEDAATADLDLDSSDKSTVFLKKASFV